ncbi:MAG: hypothetical protein H6604_07945 [Flavobacteriales bacterium]|nr:hypothetical protein [Flavobacteriales bacterium]
MGIGFTTDTPIKVAHYGIDSSISLVDDILLEKLRKYYCDKYKIQYQEITNEIKDFRAKRITSYLNLVNDIVEKKYNEFKKTITEKESQLKAFLDILPDASSLKKEYQELVAKKLDFTSVSQKLKSKLKIGSIDVNIMTKVDKENYIKNEKLPTEYNDAHAALRGFANSKLNSSVILSAGLNPKLYSYFENFQDFYPNKNGEINKKVILKVSDYRSALIQGKFLAKKGIWVSEYRIESGLNCGGHAFATEGLLLGVILEEFKNNKQALKESSYELLIQALENKELPIPNKDKLPFKITAQGGVGTSEEHEFLLENYNINSVGWGTPFLLVPEATSVDEKTRKQLVDAKEKDLYLSGISPLGIPFNNLKNNSKDLQKVQRVLNNKPGNPCTKKFVMLNKEFSEKGLCTASIKYQTKKIKELKSLELPEKEYQKKYAEIVEKACICVGLGTSTMLMHDIDTTEEGNEVSICPGPNLAYFSKELSLKEMIQHIYGKTNVISRDDRPNVFLKELSLYLDYLENKIYDLEEEFSAKKKKYLSSFCKNLLNGIEYYENLFSKTTYFLSNKINITKKLNFYKKNLNSMYAEIQLLDNKQELFIS